MLLTDLLTDRHQKFLSGAQLDTLRKIPCKFQLNPSSRLGGVVRTRFFDFDDLRTYLRTDGKNFCQVHNQTPKGKFPEDFSSIHPAVQEELSGQDFCIRVYGRTDGRTYRGQMQVSFANKNLKRDKKYITIPRDFGPYIITKC